MTDTKTFHNLQLPNIKMWALILLIPSFLVILVTLKQEEHIHFILLNYAIILSILTTIMRITEFGYPSLIFPYIMILITITTIVPILLVKNKLFQNYAFTFSIYIIIEILKNILPNFPNDIFGSFFELVLLLAIILFMYACKLEQLEWGIIGVSALIGYSVGMIILGKDVAPLILRTVIEQLLGVEEYGIFKGSTNFFFALHFAEIFSLGVVLVLKKKSLMTIGLISTGFDLTFPPISLIRALIMIKMLKKEE